MSPRCSADFGVYDFAEIAPLSGHDAHFLMH
jgi:hypothetical protein